MADISFLNALILLGALLVLLGILSSLVASRVGAPLLLVFLIVGMLAGEDGPGGIRFDDYRMAYLVGSVSLAIILFDGGLRTRLNAFRGVLWPSITLATVGVLLTVGIVAVGALFFLDLTLLQGLLLGAVIASTDAAAVFFLLRVGDLHLKRRVGHTLEIESGTNDPVAVFLTIALVELILRGGDPSWGLAGILALHAVVGGAVGLAGGFSASWLLNRIGMPQGLHPLFVMTSAVMVYAVAVVLGGSGLLAVYLAGLVLGNRSLRAYSAIITFHDAVTWLCQIVMFVLLGLLVSPHKFIDYWIPAVATAFGLMFIARPAAVILCLAPFRYPWRERLFISWVGLRGAVGVFLASIPVLAKLPQAQLFFNVGFVVVLVSLVVQGWTIAWSARKLGVTLPRAPRSVKRVELDLPGQLELEMVGYPVSEESPILRHGATPSWARLNMVIRDDRILAPPEAGALKPGDYAYFLAPPARAPLLDRLFSTTEGAGALPFGELQFGGDLTLGAIATLYGVPIPPDQAEQTLAAYFAQAYDHAPSTGDAVTIGPLTLTVRETAGDGVSKVGLDILAVDESDTPRGLLARTRHALRGFAGRSA
jgi:cell volume regulation protein A